MIEITKLFDNKFFFIDEHTRNRLFENTGIIIKKYKFHDFRLSNIYMEMEKEVLQLQNTVVFQYVKNQNNGQSDYEKYCNTYGKMNPNRNKDSFNNLINEFENELYDPKKGVIIINQYGLLLDGQHRCCILLKMFGEDYKVKVLQLHIRYSLRRRIEIYYKLLRMRFNNGQN